MLWPLQGDVEATTVTLETRILKLAETDYVCLLPEYHFGTIMWTESSGKQSYDNLYLLDLGLYPSSVEGQFIATAFFPSQ